MGKKYKVAVFIARVQPIHNAHVEIIRRAKSIAEKCIIIIGSADQPRTYKNPFTTQERYDLVRRIATKVGDPMCETHVETNKDSMYNDQAWQARIQAIVAKYSEPDDSVAIIGHDKDSSTYYLKMFPQWVHEDIELLEPLNATDIRDLYFRKDAHEGFIRHVVPEDAFKFMLEFMKTDDYQQIIREREFIDKYKKQYASFPYPPTFVTVDCCVVCAGHVLMIKRKAEPGKNLLALPGGFLDAETDKTLQSAAIRELKEETGIKIPVPVLTGSIETSRVFDAMGRSSRGRTITHVYKIVLNDTVLPKVKGSDDAAYAKWIPLGELKSEECFEDHAEIISEMVL